MWLQIFDEDLRILDVTLNRATLIFALSVILTIIFVILAAAIIYIIVIIFIIIIVDSIDIKPVNFCSFTWPRFFAINFLITFDNVDFSPGTFTGINSLENIFLFPSTPFLEIVIFPRPFMFLLCRFICFPYFYFFLLFSP